MRRFHYPLISFGLAFFWQGLVACTAGLDRPVDAVEIDPPEVWLAAGKGQAGQVSSGWVKSFKTPKLTQLVEAGLDNNPDLAATANQVRASAENVRISHAALQPQVDFSLTGSRSRSNRDAGGGASFYRSQFSQGLSASWELDVWGRLRDQRDASYFNYEAALADYQGARLSLAASIARAFILLISAEQQVELSELTTESFKRNLRIIQRNYVGGVPGSRAIDVQFARSNVASAERTLRARLQARDEARRALERLLGRYPAGAIDATKTLPNLSPVVTIGLPAELVERRPDLSAARFDLLASASNAAATRKTLLPNLRLNGSSSIANSDLGRLTDPGFLVSSLGSSLAQPVLDGGQRRAASRRELELNQAAVNRYVSTAISAFEEVENAIAAELYLAEQENFVQQEEQQASLAVTQAERDYTEGLEGADILNLLEAQRRAFNARTAMIGIKAERILTRINLHLALGGDF